MFLNLHVQHHLDSIAWQVGVLNNRWYIKPRSTCWFDEFIFQSLFTRPFLLYYAHEETYIPPFVGRLETLHPRASIYMEKSYMCGEEGGYDNE